MHYKFVEFDESARVEKFLNAFTSSFATCSMLAGYSFFSTSQFCKAVVLFQKFKFFFE
jgi:hypothetical protein